MTDYSGQPKMSHAEFLLKADAWLKTKMPIWKADFSNLNLLVEKPINDNELKLATLYLGFIYRSNVAKFDCRHG